MVFISPMAIEKMLLHAQNSCIESGPGWFVIEITSYAFNPAIRLIVRIHPFSPRNLVIILSSAKRWISEKCPMFCGQKAELRPQYGYYYCQT